MSDTRRIGSAVLFPTDHPLDPGTMIGRSVDVDRIAMALVGGGNVVLAGPRRTGKTTVADAALVACQSDSAYVAKADLFECADACELAHVITLELLANRPLLRRAIRDAVDAGKSVLEALRPAATIRARQDLGEEIEFPLDLARAEQDPAKALDTALRLAQRLAARDKRRVVVFFYEFQDIGTSRLGNADTITRNMRAVFQRSPDVSVLFAGSIEHLMKDLFAPSERALSQFGSFHELTEITGQEWGDGIRERLQRDRTSITEDALSRLVELGEGHPRATMLIAQQAHAQALEELSRKIDHAAVVAALDRAMSSEQLRHQQQLERIRVAARFAERMAIRVAADAELYRNLKPQQASRALNALRDIGVVERAGQGRWYVSDPLLRRYLAQRRVEPLSFLRTAFDVSETSDAASIGAGPSTGDQ
ncbi:MAG: ATP-binding protein [Solirubrobacteraceae bacterium]